MSTPPDRDGSSESRYVTVVVRLLVDGRGRLLHGEYVDVEGQVQGRFAQWRDFNQAMGGLARAAVKVSGARARSRARAERTVATSKE